MIGMDTCAIIDFFIGDESLLKLIEGLDDDICLSQISYLELSFGINPKIKSHLEEEKYYDILFNTLKVVDVNNYLFRNASRLFWKMKFLGKEIGKIDSVIASSFMTVGANKIITKDRHFEKIRGLKVLSY